MKIDGTFIRYYKSPTDVEERGNISMLGVEWIRPSDGTANCKGFEIMGNGRVFSFEAEDHESMQIWLSSIKMAQRAAGGRRSSSSGEGTSIVRPSSTATDTGQTFHNHQLFIELFTAFFFD